MWPVGMYSVFVNKTHLLQNEEPGEIAVCGCARSVDLERDAFKNLRIKPAT